VWSPIKRAPQAYIQPHPWTPKQSRTDREVHSKHMHGSHPSRNLQRMPSPAEQRQHGYHRDHQPRHATHCFRAARAPTTAALQPSRSSTSKPDGQQAASHPCWDSSGRRLLLQRDVHCDAEHEQHREEHAHVQRNAVLGADGQLQRSLHACHGRAHAGHAVHKLHRGRHRSQLDNQSASRYAVSQAGSQANETNSRWQAAPPQQKDDQWCWTYSFHRLTA
jgi:hypothetical protein